IRAETVRAQDASVVAVSPQHATGLPPPRPVSRSPGGRKNPICLPETRPQFPKPTKHTKYTKQTHEIRHGPAHFERPLCRQETHSFALPFRAFGVFNGVLPSPTFSKG